MLFRSLHAGERLCAEAEGLFIAIDFVKMGEMRRQREEALREEARRTDGRGPSPGGAG